MFYGGEFTLTASCENSLKKENILYIHTCVLFLNNSNKNNSLTKNKMSISGKPFSS